MPAPPSLLLKANSTFIEDPEMAQRLMDANPNSFRKLVATFLEANGRGYWDASPEQLDRLRQVRACPAVVCQRRAGAEWVVFWGERLCARQ